MAFHRGVIALSDTLDFMQELVGIMEEYIRFVGSFEAAGHQTQFEIPEKGYSKGFKKNNTWAPQKEKKPKRRGIAPPDAEVRREFLMLKKTLEGYKSYLVDIKGDIEYSITMVSGARFKMVLSHEG